MRINLTNVLPRLTLLTKATPQRLSITSTHISSGNRISKKYEHREDLLYEIDEKGYEKDELKLK